MWTEEALKAMSELKSKYDGATINVKRRVREGFIITRIELIYAGWTHATFEEVDHAKEALQPHALSQYVVRAMAFFAAGGNPPPPNTLQKETLEAKTICGEGVIENPESPEGEASTPLAQIMSQAVAYFKDDDETFNPVSMELESNKPNKPKGLRGLGKKVKQEEVQDSTNKPKGLRGLGKKVKQEGVMGEEVDSPFISEPSDPSEVDIMDLIGKYST